MTAAAMGCSPPSAATSAECRAQACTTSWLSTTKSKAKMTMKKSSSTLGATSRKVVAMQVRASKTSRPLTIGRREMGRCVVADDDRRTAHCASMERKAVILATMMKIHTAKEYPVKTITIVMKIGANQKVNQVQ